LVSCKCLCFVLSVDSSADDELVQPTDMDWEQLLAVNFDPAADAMLLGNATDEMFSLNRNDLLYAQKYAATRTTPTIAPPTTDTSPALNDQDLERCDNDLDRFVNDLELACAHIEQRGETYRRHDLDPNVDRDQGQVDNLDPRQRISLVDDQGHAGDFDLAQGHATAQPSDDLEAFEANTAKVDENRLQDADDQAFENERCTEPIINDSDGAVLCDLDPDDLTNGPEIALCELTTDHNTVHSNYPNDPDPEASVV